MTNEIRAHAKSQIDYALGSTGRSFVVGFGQNPPVQPHHSAASCPDLPAPCDWSDFDNPGPNPQVRMVKVSWNKIFFCLHLSRKYGIRYLNIYMQRRYQRQLYIWKRDNKLMLY
jgi:hypothetical protein